MKKTKKCSKCGEEKNVNMFYKRTKSKDGLDSWCKGCKRESDKTYRANNKEKIAKKHKVYYKDNRESIDAYKKEWYENNKEEILKKRKDNYEENKETILERNREWRENNREKKRARDRKYMKENTGRLRERRRNNPQVRIADNLRRRMSYAIRNDQKTGSAVRDLGCSIGELKIHLEKQFQEGMTWENYGLHGWHIDHIKPLVSFDLTNREQFLKACHYTNLQPLWAKDNLSKGAK